MSSPRLVLAATGLRAEARIAAGAGVLAIAGGGDPARLALLLQNAVLRGPCAIISFGIAGGLAPGLQPGTVVIGRSVVEGNSRTMADQAWVERLADRLPHARLGDLAGGDGIIAGAAGKRDLRDRTGALAVDMESHIAARLAAQHGLPFAALRVIADPAQRSLPHAATVGMRPDGSTDAVAILRSLSRRPGDVPALIRTAWDARASFAALRHCRALLSSDLAFEAGRIEASERARAHDQTSIAALQAALFGGSPSEAPVENT